MTHPLTMRLNAKFVAEGRPLLIGEANGPNGDPTKPLEGAVGKRIAELAGIDRLRYLARFARVNLLSRYEGVDENGVVVFNARSARGAAKHVLNDLIDDYEQKLGNREPLPLPAKLVLLGRRVAAAFYLDAGRPWFEWSPLASGPPGCRVVVVPHPLGSLEWWTDELNEARAKDFFQRLACPADAS